LPAFPGTQPSQTERERDEKEEEEEEEEDPLSCPWEREGLRG
jgi:hypothetical protein